MESSASGARLTWQYNAAGRCISRTRHVHPWNAVKSIIEQILADYSAGSDGFVMRHTRLPWMALVKLKSTLKIAT